MTYLFRFLFAVLVLGVVSFILLLLLLAALHVIYQAVDEDLEEIDHEDKKK